MVALLLPRPRSVLTTKSSISCEKTRCPRSAVRDGGWSRTRRRRPRKEYRKILGCLHPDAVEDPERKPRFEEAFQLFKRYKARLVDDSEQADVKRDSTLPRTVEEMLARKTMKTR